MTRRLHADLVVLPTRGGHPKRFQRPRDQDSRTDHADAPMSRGHRAILRQQQAVGNAKVSRFLQRREVEANGTVGSGQTPVALSPSEIGKQASEAERDRGLTIAYAGAPLKQDPPAGMNFIASQSGGLGLGGKPAGFTGIKSAAAFTQPSFSTEMAVEKEGYKRHYFAKVQSTSTNDVTHPSFYPAPGTHDNAVSKQKDATYHYFWKISEKISELVREGEQEHLNDAQRAFDLTYGLIANEVNAMAGQNFGPAETPEAAKKLAEDELRRRLPAALGVDPRNWFNVLEAMLSMTLQRDRTHLHDVIPGNAEKRGTSFYIPLETTAQTSVDQVGSEQIVNYPSATKGGAAGGSSPPAASAKAHAHDNDT